MAKVLNHISFNQEQTTLWYGAKVYLIYLHSMHLPPARFAAHLRVLRHILNFYGYDFKLSAFTGEEIYQYINIYDRRSDDPFIRERGQLFWTFVDWLKKNEMIPGFTMKRINQAQ